MLSAPFELIGLWKDCKVIHVSTSVENQSFVTGLWRVPTAMAIFAIVLYLLPEPTGVASVQLIFLTHICCSQKSDFNLPELSHSIPVLRIPELESLVPANSFRNHFRNHFRNRF